MTDEHATRVNSAEAMRAALEMSMYEMVTLVARVDDRTARNLQACVDAAKAALAQYKAGRAGV